MSDGLILWKPNGEPADGTIQPGTLAVFQDNDIMKQKDSNNVIKSLVSSSPFDFVVSQNGTGFTTIQSAVDAAELAGNPAAILILPGTYTENVTIVASDIHMHGFTKAAGSTLVIGDISVTASVVHFF